MINLRPIGRVVGLLVACLGGVMLVPTLVDLAAGHSDWEAFFLSAIFTSIVGTVMMLASGGSFSDSMTVRETFVLTTAVWLFLPVFGAIPFALSSLDAAYVDAFFEAMSGLTTTGSTVLEDPGALSRGHQLWRGILQWTGGIGIIVVATVFLPALRVGGMQIFRKESLDSSGAILPKAAEIARATFLVYLALTVCCALSYLASGMSFFDAAVHSMTTLSTGGFGNYADSFGGFSPMAEYVAVVFMILAAIPFVCYVDMLSPDGDWRAVFHDTQVVGFLRAIAFVCVLLVLWVALRVTGEFEHSLRKSLFNGVSLLTGTGFTSADYTAWGSFPVALLFLAGLVGGCAGSTTCSIKIFRFQVLFAAIHSRMRLIHSPNGVFMPRYGGRRVSEEALSSVMAFFVMFIATLAVVCLLLSLSGLDLVTSLSGAATALANVGPGLGGVIGPTGNFGELNDFAKWLLSFTMLVGRLELMAIYTLLLFYFWRG